MIPSWYHEEWPYSTQTIRDVSIECYKKVKKFNRKQNKEFIAYRR